MTHPLVTLRILTPLLGLIAAGCMVDLSDDADGAPPLEAPPEAAVSVACETAVPDPAAFDDRVMTLGIVPTDVNLMVALDARVTVADDGRAFSVVAQAVDPATGERVGEVQGIDDVPVDERGIFRLDELILELPAGVAYDDEGEPLDAEQTALAAVTGGFCVATGSIQGRFEGWTFTPTTEETVGAWFIAPVTDPDVLD